MSNRFLPRRNEDPSPVTAKARKRVSNACARCRKYKARCDSFRPCALCKRNNAFCEPRRSLGETPKKAASVSNSADTGHRQSPRFHGISSSPASITPNTPFTRNCPISTDNSEAQSHRQETTHASVSDGPRNEEQDDSTSAIAIARKIYQLRRDGVAIDTTSAIPDGDYDRSSLSANQDSGQKIPIAVLLGRRFPDREQIRMLIEDFFDTVHWFSLVIYAPTFQTLLSSVEDGYAHQSDVPFLLLLSMVLSMASWYRAKQSDDEEHRKEWQQWSDELRGIVEARILQLMGNPSLLATQTCILLGSHHVYHGQPNLSFSLLGATIKMAHTLALHRQPTSGDDFYIEERKRVWWTIYTWDRFASISHCRPLSINGKDCDVDMPEDFAESGDSGSLSAAGAGEDAEPVCYSRYQKELSTLYVMASPALEEIFGCISTESSRRNFESKYATLVGKITKSLMEWHRQLPPHLNWSKARLHHLDDNMDDCTREMRSHALQSLALQMTFDNLLIVLYRPCLARHIDHLPTSYSTQRQLRRGSSTSSGSFFGHGASSSAATEIITGTEHWCTAALRTTQLTEHSRLIQLATNSHLMVFMAMNMFHAAVVLIILALTDPLCDDTQAIKRSVTRVLHLQRALAKHSTFSKQTSDVLKLLIHRILQREQEAILGSDDMPLADVHTYTSSAEKGRTAWYSRTMSQVNTSDNMLPADTTSFLYSDSQDGAFHQSSEDQNLTNLSIVQRLDEGLTDVRQALNMSRNPSTIQQVHPAPTSFDTAMPELGYLQAGWQLPPQPGYMDGGNSETQQDYMAEPTDSLFWLWNLRRDINQ